VDFYINAAIRLIHRSSRYDHQTTSHQCSETFTGCGLRKASISSCPCSSVDVFTVCRHGICPSRPTLVCHRLHRRRLRSSSYSQLVFQSARLFLGDNRAFPVASATFCLHDVTSAPTLIVFGKLTFPPIISFLTFFSFSGSVHRVYTVFSCPVYSYNLIFFRKMLHIGRLLSCTLLSFSDCYSL